MIAESIAAYPGHCACPYNLMANGKRCGHWSAYSKPGGRHPLCYATDITDDAVRSWRARHGQEQ